MSHHNDSDVSVHVLGVLVLPVVLQLVQYMMCTVHMQYMYIVLYSICTV